MKDWEYYKNNHLQNEIDRTNSWFKWIEEHIESPIERIAFMYLIELSNQLFGPYELVVKPQVEIGEYRVDFLVHHWDTKTWIIVECDGHEFHEKTKKQAAHDKKRDRYFTKENYFVLRYTGSQVCNNPLEIYEDVADIVMNRQREMKGA